MPNVGGGYSKNEDGKVTQTRAPTATQVRRSAKKADPKPAQTKPAKGEETPKPKASKPSGKSQD